MKKCLLIYSDTNGEYDRKQFDSEKEAHDTMENSFNLMKKDNESEGIGSESSVNEEDAFLYYGEKLAQWHIEEVSEEDNEERLKALLYNAVCYMSEQGMSTDEIAEYLGSTEEELRSLDALYEEEE